ncbi:MAG: LysM peptidoglycan-binding domain-containing protein [Acidimicrobiales bacterium]
MATTPRPIPSTGPRPAARHLTGTGHLGPTAGSTSSNASHPTARLAAWTALLVLTGLALAGLGRIHHGLLGAPPLAHPAGLLAWAQARGAPTVGFALVRLAALIVVGYLLLITVAGTALRVAGWTRSARGLDLVTLPGVRHLLGGVAALSLSTASVTVSLTGPAWAAPVGTGRAAEPAASSAPVRSPAGGTGHPLAAGPVPPLPVEGVALDPEPMPWAPAGPASRAAGHAAWSVPVMRLLAPHDGPASDPPAARRAPAGAPAVGMPGSDGSAAVPQGAADPAAGQRAAGGRGRQGSSAASRLTRRPATPAPGPFAATAARPSLPATWTVRTGDDLWSIAEATLVHAWGHQPSDEQVDGYWLALIRVNRSRLAEPGVPDLIFPGQVFLLPPVPRSPDDTQPSPSSR